VVSANFLIDAGLNGIQAVVDGGEGILILNPTSGVLENYRQEIYARDEEWEELLSRANEKAITRDGKVIEVVANIGSVADARQALEYGAEGVGLLRTEFLYIDRESFPDLEDQIDVYRQIGEIMEDRPIVVRTLDIGGDKPLPYLDLAEEPNPFLGWRAIRMIRENPQILSRQLKALLLGFEGRDLRLMLPLVSRVEEVQHARRILDQVQADLRDEEGFIPEKLQFGMMVEVPSAALQAGDFSEYVDFFSIGTNDLAQYTLAVDRTNERVADLASPFHPAVIRLIAAVIEQAHAAGKWVGLCGEMAGNELAAPLLLGLGLDEFSMAPPAVPRIKATLRALDQGQSRKDAERIMKHATTADVLRDLEGIISKLKK
jgi:phosphoenolpyruvate-protein phosphotransferase